MDTCYSIWNVSRTLWSHRQKTRSTKAEKSRMKRNIESKVYILPCIFSPHPSPRLWGWCKCRLLVSEKGAQEKQSEKYSREKRAECCVTQMEKSAVWKPGRQTRVNGISWVRKAPRCCKACQQAGRCTSSPTGLRLASLIAHQHKTRNFGNMYISQ